MTDEICVVLACDQDYAVHVGAAIAAAATAEDRQRPIDAHVLSSGLSLATANKLARLEETLPNLSVTVHHRSIAEFSDWVRAEHISRSAYLRLQMAEVLPSHHERAIYLDADAISLRALDELWEHELGASSLAAARDTSTPFASSPRGLVSHEEMGIPGDAPYFNSGVLLIDMAKWREADPLRFGREYVARFGSVQQALDQEILNACFAGTWLELHPRWNASPRLLNFDSWVDEEAKHVFRPFVFEASNDPSIVHFLGPRKPWHFKSSAPWKNHYLDAVSASGWFDSRMEFLGWRAREAMEAGTRRASVVRRSARRFL